MSKRRRWTDADRDKLAVLISQGKNKKQIAKALHTSTSSIERHFGKQILGNVQRGKPAQKFSDAERASVIAMASYGAPKNEIAEVLGVSRSTLLKHFGDAMKTAPTKANAAVARSLYRKAVTDGDVNAQKYWLKNRAAGWEDRVSIDGSMAISGEVSVEHSVILTDAVRQLSPEGREALRIVLTELQEARSLERATDVRAIA